MRNVDDYDDDPNKMSATVLLVCVCALRSHVCASNEHGETDERMNRHLSVGLPISLYRSPCAIVSERRIQHMCKLCTCR